MKSELELEELFKKCKSRNERLQIRRRRADSAPKHLNLNRQIRQEQRLIEQTKELMKAKQ